ncbi:hypothetical protein AMS68_004467 [Peltaster fructicola]|uniref:Clathrin/coatomer adaptor adaptin-like N-terminal domain-containing protein n=1 Tax=Peltaster fructicola TaxID=286661 RepID=A0A6H0XWZ2_9PEZI|nr:hypothetical protein AMS68_004467 [Peltaster fructicola]
MESVSRLGSLLESARDLTLEAAKDVGPRRSTRALPAQQIKKLLDSRNERDVLDGLRRVVSMQYTNPPQPTLTYFPAVLKTLSNQSPSTRPLVYNYLLHHAEADPDTALLAINTIQKSLSDSNPRVRALALKTMAGIRVSVISQIVSLAIKKGTADLSPIVRKTAALACVKCIRLDPSTRPQIEEHIAVLLADQQYYVAGAAVQAFMQICPDRLDLIHPVYRKLCKMVVDMDEWGQIATLRLMTFYSRKCFPRRTKRVKKAPTQEQRAQDFYAESDTKTEEPGDYDEVEDVEPDLDLLLHSVQQLLQSRNSAVIVAVTRLYLYLSPSGYLSNTVGPLIGLLRSPQDIREVALYNIAQVCVKLPAQFVPHMRHFLVKSNDSSRTRILKLELLTLVFKFLSSEDQDLILAELEHFSQSHDAELVREAVRAIGRCAQSEDARTSRKCLTLLLKQIHSADTHLVGEAVEVVRHMIQREPEQHRKTVIRLAKNLDTLVSPTARASIIWLVGESAGHDFENNIAPDVLRILVKGYAAETDIVKEQIVLLGAKVYLHNINANSEKRKTIEALNSSDAAAPEPNGEDDEQDQIYQLFQHILLLARYTSSYDIRDRARMYRSLLSTASSTELASLLLLAPKPIPQAPSPSELRRDLTLGTATLVLGDEVGAGGLRGYEQIPNWVKAGDEPDQRLRAVGETRAEQSLRQSTSAGRQLDDALEADPTYRSAGSKAKTLDDWLDEEDDTDAEDDSEDEEDEEESSEYESDTESEEGTDSEDDEKAGLVRQTAVD